MLAEWGSKHALNRIGRPIDPHFHADGGDDRLVLRQLTDELMYEIRSLSGQDYVDEYATRRHEALPSQPTAIVLGDGRGAPAVTGAGAVSAAR